MGPLGAFFPDIPSLSSCAAGSLGDGDLDNHDFDACDEFNGDHAGV